MVAVEKCSEKEGKITAERDKVLNFECNLSSSIGWVIDLLERFSDKYFSGKNLVDLFSLKLFYTFYIKYYLIN